MVNEPRHAQRATQTRYYSEVHVLTSFQESIRLVLSRLHSFVSTLSDMQDSQTVTNPSGVAETLTNETTPLPRSDASGVQRRSSERPLATRSIDDAHITVHARIPEVDWIVPVDRVVGYVPRFIH